MAVYIKIKTKGFLLDISNIAVTFVSFRSEIAAGLRKGTACQRYRKKPSIAFLCREKISLRKEKSFSPGKRLDFPENDKRRDFGMKSNNQLNVPQAREAMDKFKMQAASEVGVNLTNGYNGHLTSREAGSVGGQMVKKMIEAYEQGLQ